MMFQIKTTQYTKSPRSQYNAISFNKFHAVSNLTKRQIQLQSIGFMPFKLKSGIGNKYFDALIY